MTWPVCLRCNLTYIPLEGMTGCPWCIRRRTNICPTCGHWKQHEAKQCRNCAGRGLAYKPRAA